MKSPVLELSKAEPLTAVVIGTRCPNRTQEQQHNASEAASHSTALTQRDGMPFIRSEKLFLNVLRKLENMQGVKVPFCTTHKIQPFFRFITVLLFSVFFLYKTEKYLYDHFFVKPINLLYSC